MTCKTKKNKEIIGLIDCVLKRGNKKIETLKFQGKSQFTLQWSSPTQRATKKGQKRMLPLNI